MSAAIYYHPEAYTTTGPKLMGRNAAGEAFLRGFLLYAQASEFWLQVQKIEHAQYFVAAAKALNRKEPVRVVDKNNLAALSQPGVVYHPGPGIGEHAFYRAHLGHTRYSLCGITHTTSSATAMDAITALLTAPVQPWDALICTSSAVKNMVERLLQAQVDYLKDRLGITKITLPQLPIIPLGIHTQDFVFTPEQKRAARDAIGADSNAIVVLFMGRLSFHAKAHPLAMYQALELAAKQTRHSVILVECGWFANDYIKNAFATAQQLACPSVRVITLDGRKPENRQIAWASADLFCSLSDNIQESFGITPIEAMATGIPVVVSDWDGYKDTVRDGIDGFRIPTIMPPAGLADDLAYRHAVGIDTYDMYIGFSASLVAVDVKATAQAFVQLFTQPALRAQMGQAGQARAKAVYDWSVIIPQYEQLWQQLNELRCAKPAQQLTHPWPARMDPLTAFASYPTQTLRQDTLLALVDDRLDAALQRYQRYINLAMVNYTQALMPSTDEVTSILMAASQGPQTAQQLISHFPAKRQALMFRSLTWLIKLNLLRQVA